MAIFKSFFIRHASDVLCPKCINLFQDVTSFNDAVTSSVMLQCCACGDHVTFQYERLVHTPLGALFLEFVLVSGLIHQRPAGIWCLMHVGCDMSNVSLDWILRPSNIIVVLVLVNSTVSPMGELQSQQDLGVLPNSLLVVLPQDCHAFWLVPVCIMFRVALW